MGEENDGEEKSSAPGSPRMDNHLSNYTKKLFSSGSANIVE